MSKLADFLKERGYLEKEGIYEAFKNVDREDFVREDHKAQAYDNIPLPIGSGQTISQPQVVAFMIELLDPQKDDVVLDVGSGSGWTTALLASIATEGRVVGIERDPEVYEFGKNNLKKYNFLKEEKVKLFLGDGKKGRKEEGPFDKILVSAADKGFDFPSKIKDQLKDEGRVVIPIKSSIFLFTKRGEDFERREYPGFSFVPLV